MRKRLGGALRLLVVLLVAAGIVAAVEWRGLVQPATLKDQIAGSPLAPLVFIAICVASSLVFVPRTLLALAGGLLFGLWWGVLWATVGSTAGALLGFLLARYVSAGIVDAESLPRLAAVLKAAERGGWRTMAILRLLPLPHTPVNYALGITRVDFGSYALGSLIGMVPMTFVYAQLGASGNNALSGGNWLVPLLVALAFLAASLLLPRLGFVRRSLRLGAE